MSVASMQSAGIRRCFEPQLDTAASSRRELRQVVLQALNASGIPYCLLGSGGDSGDCAGCDMDFAVLPQDEHRVPKLLAAAAASIEAHLVQAIRHEISATYFVVARQQGPQVAFINPDCTTDYRRGGRLWMRGDRLLAERSFDHDFYRPALEREFQYYLVKQVLKQSITERQWQKLLALHSATGPSHSIAGFWSERSLAEIHSVLREKNLCWFKEQLPRLLGELKSSSSVERFSDRAKAWLAEAARIVERVLQPTGVLVAINGGNRKQRTNLAQQLANRMAPAFRRTQVLSDGFPPIRVAAALIRSTLVVYAGKYLWPRIGPGALRISYDVDVSPEKNTELAVAALLDYLERRMLRRLQGTAEG